MTDIRSSSPDKEVLVCGFPRSGNTWLARLLGEALSSPVSGWGAAHPLSEEGLNRKGPYVVRQLHLKPTWNTEGKQFIETAYFANIAAWQGEKVIHIYRDPRDVATSVKHYWHLRHISDALQATIEGGHPVSPHGTWANFVEDWFNENRIPVFQISYRRLREQTFDIMQHLMLFIGAVVSVDRLDKTISNQSFDTRRREINGSGDKYPYGASIQLHAMRKGVAGDWVNHFTPEDTETSREAWGEFMEKYNEFFMA